MIFIEVKEELPDLQKKLKDARDFIEEEARANNLWHIFKNLSEKEWIFISSLLVRFNER